MKSKVCILTIAVPGAIVIKVPEAHLNPSSISIIHIKGSPFDRCQCNELISVVAGRCKFEKTEHWYRIGTQ